MPVAAPIIASAAFSGFMAGGFAIGAFSWAAFAGSMILGGLSYALSPKPKMPGMNSTGQSTVAVRQSDLTRQIVYGHNRVVRGYAHMQSTGLNGTLHMILILCEGPIRHIGEIWVNDYCIPEDWIDAEGNVTQGRYKNYMTIRKHRGTEGQVADPKAVANMGVWTNDHRLQGTAYLYVTMKKNQDIYPTGVPNITAIVEGQEIYDPRTDSIKWSPNVALFALDYLKNGVYGLSVDNEDISLTNVAAQANICDEMVNVEAKAVTIKSIDTATDRITLNGDILELQYGDRVTVTTTGTMPGGLSAGVNYYVIPFQVKTAPRILLATSLDNALNKIAIDITSAGSGSIRIIKNGEPRYHGGGVLDTEEVLRDNLNKLVSSMAGRAICIAGFWTLLAGAWRTPNLTLGVGDVRGSGIGLKTDLSMSDSYNVVKGLFVSPVNFYQNSDYPTASYQQFIDDDNGIEAPKELNLAFTNRPTTAQRIAKIELFRGRQGIVVTSDFSMKGLQVQPGDNVLLNVDRYGWTDKPFEVTEFSFTNAEGALSTHLVLRETAQQIFDWTAGEAITYDPAPNTTMPNPFDVLIPAGVKYNSRITTTTGTAVIYTLQMQWQAHPDAFVREYGQFEIQYKRSIDSEWLPSWFVSGSLTQTDVFQSSLGVSYDMRIRALNNLGVRSAWVTLYNVSVGSSGGISDTENWQTFSDPVDEEEDWGTFSDSVTSTEDWGYFS